MISLPPSRPFLQDWGCCLLQKCLTLLKTQKPCVDFRNAGTKRRARFSYDDLLQLFTFSEFLKSCLGSLPLTLLQSCHLVVYPRTRPLSEVSFLVARLQYSPVLHHHAQFSRESQRPQQPLHGRRQHLRRLYLPPKFSEVPLFVDVIRRIHHILAPGGHWPLRCRDPIAVDFLSQGYIDQTHLWKTFPRLTHPS